MSTIECHMDVEEDPPFEDNPEPIDHIQTFVIHYFRSETYRETAWRRRLDVTSNGAVVVTGGMLSFAFSRPDIGHTILLANVVLMRMIFK